MIGLNPQSHLLILLVLGSFSCSVQSLRFELQSGQAKCVAENIRINSMTVANYKITNVHDDQPLLDSHTITLRVSSSDGSSVYHYGENVQSGQFGFVAVMGGDYLACFWAANNNPKTNLTIDFVWKTGVPAKDWSKVAKKTQVDGMTQELQYLNEVISSIHDEMFYLRKEQKEMELHNWETNTRMFWLSLISLCVCISVAGLQLWHLKAFFQKKKIL